MFAEATVLSLYDPDRSRTILENGEIASPDAFRLALRTQLQQMQQRNGEGFRLLTGRVTSPTLLRQIDDLLQKFPKAAWHAYEPIDEDNAAAGAALAFGKRLRSVPHLDKARVLVALDADPLGQGPSQLSNARGFAARRRPQRRFSRIYSIETAPTLTGAKADHRIALQPQLISEMAIAIAHVDGRPHSRGLAPGSGHASGKTSGGRPVGEPRRGRRTGRPVASTRNPCAGALDQRPSAGIDRHRSKSTKRLADAGRARLPNWCTISMPARSTSL